MSAIPTRAGERYLCFVVEREDRGWGGPYGQYRRPLVWRCIECGYKVHEYQHAATLCPGKDDGYRIEREFARHIAEREYQ